MYLESQERIKSQYPTVKNIQLWHTPTELFQPFYGYAIACAIIQSFTSQKIAGPLQIIEIGAGNGTLMKNICQFIHKNHPDLYSLLSYEIIEISPALAERQRKTLESIPSALGKVKITRKSVLDLENGYKTKNHAFVIALEVLDNLSHDLVCYNPSLDQAFQGTVEINNDGSLEQSYIPVPLDSLLDKYLKIREKTNYKRPSSPLLDRITSALNPWKPNLINHEFVPTLSFKLLSTLINAYPRHTLLFSDFNYLPDQITMPTSNAISAPVVQTRIDTDMINVPTYLVDPGHFDIFFPTDFNLLGKVYESLLDANHSIDKELKYSVLDHGDFLKRYTPDSILRDTQTQSGESPMLEYYENVQFFMASNK